MGVFRRSGTASISVSSVSARDEEPYWVLLPNLIEFLSSSTWPDGASRSPGTVMLFREAGLWKAWLHDRDALQGTFLSAPTLGQLLIRCDEVVGTGEGDWRPDARKGKKS